MVPIINRQFAISVISVTTSLRDQYMQEINIGVNQLQINYRDQYRHAKQQIDSSARSRAPVAADHTGRSSPPLPPPGRSPIVEGGRENLWVFLGAETIRTGRPTIEDNFLVIQADRDLIPNALARAVTPSFSFPICSYNSIHTPTRLNCLVQSREGGKREGKGGKRGGREEREGGGQWAPLLKTPSAAYAHESQTFSTRDPCSPSGIHPRKQAD